MGKVNFNPHSHTANVLLVAAFEKAVEEAMNKLATPANHFYVEEKRAQLLAALSEIAPKCFCEEPTTLGVVHRADGPCFHYQEPAQPCVVDAQSLLQRWYDLYGGSTLQIREKYPEDKYAQGEMATLDADTEKFLGINSQYERN